MAETIKYRGDNCRNCRAFLHDFLLNERSIMKDNFGSTLQLPVYKKIVEDLIHVIEKFSHYLFMAKDHEDFMEILINQQFSKNLEQLNITMPIEDAKSKHFLIYVQIKNQVLELFIPDLKSLCNTFLIECIEKGLHKIPKEHRNLHNLNMHYKLWYIVTVFQSITAMNSAHHDHSKPYVSVDEKILHM